MALALATSMMGVGFAPGQAQLLGDTIVAKTAVGTAQGGSSPKAYAGEIIRLTTAGGATAITVDSGFPVGASCIVQNITATTALLFPPSGCAFDQGSGDASTSIAQNKARLVIRLSPTVFMTMLGG